MHAEPRLAVLGAATPPRAIEPEVRLRLELSVAGVIASGQLVAQVSVEPRRRTLSDEERALLTPLLGPPALDSRGSAAVVWVQAPVHVPPFEDRVELEVGLPATLGLEHAMGKLLTALRTGSLPITVALRGTLFRRSERGLDALYLPRALSASHPLDISSVRAAIARCLGDRRPLSLQAELFDRLERLRLSRGASSLDETIESLLPAET